MRTEAELLDACLGLLKVGNRETLDGLLDDKMYDPLGCGCCAYTPGRPNRVSGETPPLGGFVYDKNYVTWRAEDGSWKERDE